VKRKIRQPELEMPKKPKVFICYAREDAEIAFRLYRDLKAASVDPWLDRECLRPGQRWSDAIAEAIRESDYFLALFSSVLTKKRGYVQKELKEALAVWEEVPGGSIYLIPARLDDCQLPTDRFREYQWVDLFPAYDQGLEKILRVIRPGATMAVEDESDLTQAGWGVIFPADADPAIADALMPLLDFRRKQVGTRHVELYREFAQERGYQPGQTYLDFLEKNGMGPGIPDPLRVPTYLLIVGDPEQIPFEFQYGLGVQYCVGRVHFDRLEDYRHYAANIAAAEEKLSRRQGRVALFGPQHSSDIATIMLNRDLLLPLFEALRQRFPSWDVSLLDGARATKRALLSLLSGSHRPDLLFIGSHGIGRRAEDARQLPEQGSIVCADWDGTSTNLTSEHYCSAGDLERISLHGMILFLFASYSAGTSAIDDMSFVEGYATPPGPAATRSFLSALAKKMLGQSGVFALIGHVNRTWAHSFVWGAVPQIQGFEKIFSALLAGNRVGIAHRYLSALYAELGSHALQQVRAETKNDRKLMSIQIATLAARNSIVIGDPAVRILVEGI
jgi:hypothetical protein